MRSGVSEWRSAGATPAEEAVALEARGDMAIEQVSNWEALPAEVSPAPRPADRRTLEVAEDVLSDASPLPWYRRLCPFLGPAFVASVAFVDPGNYATNIQGGAQFGYRLLWVVAASNLMAMFVQALSAKLGIATGRNLAELCRDAYAPWATWGLWLLMELVAMATDLAEFLGAALGFNLLAGIPLLPAGLLTGATTFLLLALDRRGFRPLERAITALVGVVAASYLIETVLARPAWGQVVFHALVPAFGGPASVLLATGILGATVMPHVIFLHSALTQGRIVTRDPDALRRLYRFECVDVILAMGLAMLVNMAMLIMAAATFFQAGQTTVGSIEGAYRTLTPLLGPAASGVFAVSLLAAGLSSASVGTLAGQVVMQGFLRRHIPVWLRRALTMLPALALIAVGHDPTHTLVLSQAVLSFGLPFALVPLLRFTARRDLMGGLVNRRLTTGVAWLVTLLVLALNGVLLAQTARGGG